MVQIRNRSKHRVEWQTLVKQYQQSQLSLVDFCRQEGLVSKTFENWVRRSRLESAAASAPTSGFIRVQEMPVANAGQLRCYFPSGVRLEWDAGVSAECVLPVLRSLSC